MDLLYIVLIALVIGIIAKLFMPNRDPSGFIITTLIGIVGTMLAKFTGKFLKWSANGEAVGLFASIGGAIILLILYQMLMGHLVR